MKDTTTATEALIHTIKVMSLFAVYTTIDQGDVANTLAEAAINQGLAACVQLSDVNSIYRWQGVVEHATEIRIMFKTNQAQLEPLRQLILSLHPYDLPAIHAVQLDHLHAPYAAWILQNSNGGNTEQAATGAGADAMLPPDASLG